MIHFLKITLAFNSMKFLILMYAPFLYQWNYKYHVEPEFLEYWSSAVKNIRCPIT